MTLWAVVSRDLRQIRRHGLWLLLFFAFILFIIGFVGMGLVADQFEQWGTRPGWTESIAAGVSEDGEGLPAITLLDAVYGYSVLVTMFIIPIAFITAYNHEMKRGTVRTLTLYPLDVLRITIAKLVYAVIVGLILSAIVFFLPTARLGREVEVVATIFFITYLFTLLTVAVGAFIANGIALGTGRMRVRPTSFSFLLVLFSFIFAVAISGFIFGALGSFMGLPNGGAALVDAVRPLAFLSSYHQGGLLLSGLLGVRGSRSWRPSASRSSSWSLRFGHLEGSIPTSTKGSSAPLTAAWKGERPHTPPLGHCLAR